MNFACSTQINQPIDEAIEKLESTLLKQHPGIVSDVNVSGIVKSKLNQDMSVYRLQGACNPGMAKTMIDNLPEMAFYCSALSWH